jgi:hypothetical protein
MHYLRDDAMTALIFGFFASMWFGWAQAAPNGSARELAERPPPAWRRWLTIAAVVSLAVGAAGGYLAWRHWGDGSALSEPGAMRRYGITVGIEFALAGVGAAILGVRKHPELIAPWICLVVGVHFAPLAPILKNPMLYALAALMSVVALVAVPLARRRDLAPSAVTGVGAGVSLLVFAIISLISVL